jgi:hypothetical protein
MGERFMAEYLENHGVEFQEQAAVKELPLQHFDFAILKNGEVIGYIEV